MDDINIASAPVFLTITSYAVKPNINAVEQPNPLSGGYETLANNLPQWFCYSLRSMWKIFGDIKCDIE